MQTSLFFDTLSDGKWGIIEGVPVVVKDHQRSDTTEASNERIAFS